MWTKKSYDALYNWIDKTKRRQVKKILLSDGLEDVVNRLEAAQNMGEWYKITHEAAASVGPEIYQSQYHYCQFQSHYRLLVHEPFSPEKTYLVAYYLLEKQHELLDQPKYRRHLVIFSF